MGKQKKRSFLWKYSGSSVWRGGLGAQTSAWSPLSAASSLHLGARCSREEPRGGFCPEGGRRIPAEGGLGLLGGSRGDSLCGCSAHALCRASLSRSRLTARLGPGCGPGPRTLRGGVAAFLERTPASGALAAGQPAKAVE